MFVGNLLTALVGYGLFAVTGTVNRPTAETPEQAQESLRKNGEVIERQLRELQAKQRR